MDHVEGGLAFGMTVGLGQVTLHNHAVAVLHQRMSDEAQHGPGAGGFLVEPRVRIGGRDMRCVRALLALEIDLGIAVGFGIAGHRVGLG